MAKPTKTEMSTTKLKLNSVVVQHGQQPFHSTYDLIATVEGTPKGTVQIKLRLEWEAGRYSFGRRIRLGLDTDWQHQKLIHAVGINRIDDISGLKKEAMRVARQYRDTFKPTEDQVADMASGTLDSQFIVTVASSNRALIAFKKLAYGSWQFEGQAVIIPDGEEIRVIINDRSHSSGYLSWIHGTNKESYLMPGILDSAKDAVCEYIKPAAKRWFDAKASARHYKEIEEVEKDLKYRRDDLERHRMAVTQLEQEVAEAEQKLAGLKEKQ